MNTDIFLANSKKQSLSAHSVGVANLALSFFKNLKIEQSTPIKKTFDNIQKMEECIFLSGLLHDIGKLDKNFQDFIKEKKVNDLDTNPLDGVHFAEAKPENRFSFLNYPRHNEISWAISTHLIPDDLTAQYAIYYHHAKVNRNNDNNWNKIKILESILDNSFNINDLKSNCSTFFNEILQFENNIEPFKNKIKSIVNLIDNISTDSYDIASPQFLFHVTYEKYITETTSKDIKEIKNLLVRSLVVSADRIISSLKIDELNYYIENNEWSSLCHQLDYDSNLTDSITNMLDSFSVENETNPENLKRDSEQKLVAENLSKNNQVSTLFGPAGCGKTKIFLEWYRNKTLNKENKKLFIIAPRKMICSSLFNELKNKYIPAATIELITGEEKIYWDGYSTSNIEELNNNQINADVTITTIDQLVSIMLSHKKIDLLLQFLDSYVVFDEFHEFFNIPGIVLLFKIFIKLKIMMNDSRTLLVSATPNYYFLESVLGLNIDRTVQYIDTFNKEIYQLQIHEHKGENGESILFDKQKEGSIVIFNTAIDSQKSTIYVRDEKTINFHSKFTPNHKKEIYQNIIKNWGHKNPHSDSVLRAGPIVQASLNISTMDLFTQICSAENWCQRIGRANRFASKSRIAKVTTVFNEKTKLNEISKNPEIQFLSKTSSKNQTITWLDFLISKNFINSDTQNTTLSEIYSQYKQFHSLENTKIAYELDFQETIKSSIDLFSKNDFTPIQFWKPIKKTNNNKISSNSMRGSSVYVLPVCYDIYNGLLDWLYLPSNEIKPQDAITLSENDINIRHAIIHNQKSVLSNTSINGFSGSEYSAIKNYKNMSPNKIIKEAKNLTSPIILSYTNTVFDYQNKNKNGFIYLTKGNIKIGLYECVNLTNMKG